MTLAQTENVTRRYGGVHALDASLAVLAAWAYRRDEGRRFR